MDVWEGRVPAAPGRYPPALPAEPLEPFEITLLAADWTAVATRVFSGEGGSGAEHSSGLYSWHSVGERAR